MTEIATASKAPQPRCPHCRQETIVFRYNYTVWSCNTCFIGKDYSELNGDLARAEVAKQVGLPLFSLVRTLWREQAATKLGVSA